MRGNATENSLNLIINTFVKLNPFKVPSNPIMVIIWIVAIITLFVPIFDLLFNNYTSTDPVWFVSSISIFIWLSLFFSNFAQNLAEKKNKLYSDKLHNLKNFIICNKLLDNGEIEKTTNDKLEVGDKIVVYQGEIIPLDGKVIKGVASVDESAITGESAAVIRDNSKGKCNVKGGTKVLSNQITISITHRYSKWNDDIADISTKGYKHKTETEQILNIILIGMTFVFIVLTIFLFPISVYFGLKISLITLLALLVCITPTTISALSSAISISGIQKLLKNNIVVLNSEAIEKIGYIDTVIFDKTGTITKGDRMATDIYPIGNTKIMELAEYLVIASINDDTLEGVSILGYIDKKYGISHKQFQKKQLEKIPYSEETRLSGNIYHKNKYIKASFDVIKTIFKQNNWVIPNELFNIVKDIGNQGATPIILAIDNEIKGVVKLQDVIKPGIKERIPTLESLGVKPIIITGDNYYTTKNIAEEVGIQSFICESTPEKKVEFIKDLQEKGKIVAMIADGKNDSPALQVADLSISMDQGSAEVKELSNIVDLDNNPTKIIEVIEIGKQLLITRGSLTIFSLMNDIAKYFIIIPAIFADVVPDIGKLDFMNLHSPYTAILSAVVFNALIIPLFIPIALKIKPYTPEDVAKKLTKILLFYGIGGLLLPFMGIKLIDIIVKFLILP